MTGKDGKVSARPATPHRETVAKGEKSIFPRQRENVEKHVQYKMQTELKKADKSPR